MAGTTPFKRGDSTEHLNNRGSFGFPCRAQPLGEWTVALVNGWMVGWTDEDSSPRLRCSTGSDLAPHGLWLHRGEFQPEGSEGMLGTAVRQLTQAGGAGHSQVAAHGKKLVEHDIDEHARH
jgi:hypothetical protein